MVKTSIGVTMAVTKATLSDTNCMQHMHAGFNQIDG